MRRIYLLLLFCSSIALQSAYAQPTFTFSPQQVVANQGDLVCVDVTVEDFTDILGVRFSISWDAGVLDYQSITNINPTVTGLDITDFGTNQSGMGIITFDWSNGQPCATATSGVTLPDNVVLFSVCFIASGIYGNHTSIEIADEPLERYVTRLNANCNDIGEFINPGFVSVGTPPLTINVSSADGFTDDVVCIDFNVEDFDDIIAFQYAIKWDSAVLEYQSSTPMNLPLFSSANIGTTQTDSGILNLSWNTTSNSGETLPDGTQILQVCFKIIGACGQNSAVYVSDNPPLPIEVVNSIAGGMGGTNIGLLQNEGNVVVNCFNPNGITLTVGDKNVCPGESFTVDVRVSNFSNISKLQFNLQWNKNVIQMVQPKVSYPQSGGCFFFGSSVNANTPGVVKVDWTSLGPSCSLNDDFILMRLHFKAIGTGGSNSTVSVVNPIYVEQFGPPVENIGINNNNGLVSICQLTGPTIVASSMDANPGDTVCINFSVQDFDEITSMLYTIGWEPNVLQYIGVQGFNLTGLSAANFYEAQALTLGVVGVEWANAGGVSSPDGSSIFTLCFRVVGDPGECATIWFSDIPYPIDIQTTASNNTNVGLNGQPGQVCTLNPLSFVTNLPDVFTSTNSQVCLDVTVENFLQLTNMQYSMNWNPAILQYDTILPAGNLANFNAASYDDNISLTQNGQLIIDWSASNQVLGTSVPDGASIFQICFNVVGNSGDCSVVSISDFPAPINITTATTGDSNLGMTAGQGSACVSASLVLLDQVITGIECPSDQNGAIDITVAGGSGNYLFQWSGPGVIPTAEDQTGLDVGNYFLTVTDAQNPGLVLQDIFTVGYTANVTIADAGGDTTFACGNFFLILNGSGSSSGANISYFWEAVSGGGLVLPGEETKMNPQIIGGSCYQLTVTNSDNGCVATDQICIDAPQVPFVEASAGAAPTLTCTADTVELDGSLSSFGFDIQWTAGPGGSIVPGTENYLTPLVTTSAMYYLTLSAPATGCSATDSVFVAADMQLPVALAGPDTTIGCNDPSVPVDGSSSSVGLQYIYEWSPMGAGEICGDTTSASTTICAPGIYQLVVTDTLNGCTAVDFVEVTGDTLKPSIDAGVDQTLTCAIDAVTLDGVVNTGSGNYTYNWSFTPGGNIQSGQGTLNPVVDGAATYTLEVTDNDNGCQASSEVIVDENKTPPVVAAVTDGPISCADAEAVLDGTGSSTGLSFTQQWFDENGMLLTDSLTATVTTPGMYKFLVTDSSNGCQDSVLVEVEDWTIPPVANAGDDQAKTCVLTEVPLQGTIDTGNPNLVIQWSGPSLNCIQNANSTAPVVTCTGQYIMTVLDTLTGCLHKDTVMVVDDTQAPPADAGADSTLTCAVESLVLNGTSQPSDVTAAWTSIPAGLNITNPSSFNPTVSEPGTYVLTVTSDLNGCSAADLVVIGQDTVAPVADAGV
ncbi:MAG: cohesin domain-containing protein, partial [Saprospiraceae bacterium]